MNAAFSYELPIEFYKLGEKRRACTSRPVFPNLLEFREKLLIKLNESFGPFFPMFRARLHLALDNDIIIGRRVGPRVKGRLRAKGEGRRGGQRVTN